MNKQLFSCTSVPSLHECTWIKTQMGGGKMMKNSTWSPIQIEYFMPDLGDAWGEKLSNPFFPPKLFYTSLCRHRKINSKIEIFLHLWEAHPPWNWSMPSFTVRRCRDSGFYQLIKIQKRTFFIWLYLEC